MIRSIIILVLLSLLASCSLKAPPSSGQWTAEKLLSESQALAKSAERSKSRNAMRKKAKLGLEFATRCIEKYPEMNGCYYYRAINTGLYYKARIIGYQRGIKSMIQDCEHLIKTEEKYDSAGAYRILGQIYSQLPLTGGRADDVVRDMDLALSYLRRAVLLSPEFPENRLFLAEILVELGETNEAGLELQKANFAMNDWKKHDSYKDWKKLAEKLEKELKDAKIESNK